MAAPPKAETTRPSSAAASVPTAAADCVCPFVDLETQNNLAARLLGCLANETVLQKRSAEDGAQRLRLMLLPDAKDRKKKGGLTLAALGERVSQAEAKASKTSLGHEGFTTKLFTSRDELQKRHEAALANLDAGGFRHSTRAALASELLRAWDAAQTVHCGACGLVPGSEAAERHRLSCVFRPVACVHEGCVAYFSATHLESHEARCAFKLLDCPRGCGAQAQRQHLDAHLEGPCPNKPVTCPLAGLGCEAEGLTQGTLAAHVREAAGDHAVLLAASLGAHGLTLGTCLTAQAEAQAQVEALKGRLAAEEAERRELRAQVESALGQLRATSEAHASEVAALRKELGALRKSSSKEGGGAAAELKRLDAAVAGVRTAQGALAKEHGGMVAELGSLRSEQARLAHAVGSR